MAQDIVFTVKINGQDIVIKSYKEMTDLVHKFGIESKESDQILDAHSKALVDNSLAQKGLIDATKQSTQVTQANTAATKQETAAEKELREARAAAADATAKYKQAQEAVRTANEQATQATNLLKAAERELGAAYNNSLQDAERYTQAQEDLKAAEELVTEASRKQSESLGQLEQALNSETEAMGRSEEAQDKWLASVEEGRDALEALREGLDATTRPGVALAETFEKISNAGGVSSEIAQGYARQILEVIETHKRFGIEVPKSVAALEQEAKAFVEAEDAAKRATATVQRYNEMTRPGDKLAKELEHLESTGMSTAKILKIYGDEIERVVKVHQELGEEIPEIVQSLHEEQKALEEAGEGVEEVGKHTTSLKASIGNAAISVVSQMTPAMDGFAGVLGQVAGQIGHLLGVGGLVGLGVAIVALIYNIEAVTDAIADWILGLSKLREESEKATKQTKEWLDSVQRVRDQAALVGKEGWDRIGTQIGQTTTKLREAQRELKQLQGDYAAAEKARDAAAKKSTALDPLTAALEMAGKGPVAAATKAMEDANQKVMQQQQVVRQLTEDVGLLGKEYANIGVQLRKAYDEALHPTKVLIKNYDDLVKAGQDVSQWTMLNADAFLAAYEAESKLSVITDQRILQLVEETRNIRARREEMERAKAVQGEMLAAELQGIVSGATEQQLKLLRAMADTRSRMHLAQMQAAREENEAVKAALEERARSYALQLRGQQQVYDGTVKQKEAEKSLAEVTIQYYSQVGPKRQEELDAMKAVKQAEIELEKEREFGIEAWTIAAAKRLALTKENLLMIQSEIKLEQQLNEIEAQGWLQDKTLQQIENEKNLARAREAYRLALQLGNKEAEAAALSAIKYYEAEAKGINLVLSLEKQRLQIITSGIINRALVEEINLRIQMAHAQAMLNIAIQKGWEEAAIQIAEYMAVLQRAIEQTREMRQLQEAWGHVFSSIVDQWVDALDQMIFEGKGFLDTMKEMFKSWGRDLFRVFMDSLLLPMRNIMKEIGTGIAGMLSGQGTSGFAGLAGLGGAGGGIAGLIGMGTITAGTAFVGGGKDLGSKLIRGGIAGAGGLAALGLGAGLSVGMPLSSIMATMMPMLFNPITAAILGAIVGTGVLVKAFSKSSWEKAAKEVTRDFGGIDIGKSTIKSFMEGVGLTEKTFADVRREVLTSPKFLTQIAGPAAEAQGRGKEFLAGLPPELAAAYSLGKMTGDFAALNEAWMKMYGTSEKLAQALPDFAEALAAAGTEASQAWKEFQTLGETWNRLLAEFQETGYITQEFTDFVMQWGNGVKAFQDALRIPELQQFKDDLQAINNTLEKTDPWDNAVQAFLEFGVVTDDLRKKIEEFGGDLKKFTESARINKIKNEFADLAQTFLDTGENLEEMQEIFKEFGGDVSKLNLRKQITDLEELRGGFAGLREELTTFAPEMKDAFQILLETGIVNQELFNKVFQAGGDITKFWQFGLARQSQLEWERLRKDFEKTGIITAEFMAMIEKHGTAADVYTVKSILARAGVEGEIDMAKLDPVLDKIGTSIDDAVAAAATALIAELDKMDKSLGDKIEKMNKEMVDEITKVEKAINAKWDEARTTLVHEITSLHGTVDRKITDLESALVTAINEVTAAINALGDSLKSAPAYATGGYVQSTGWAYLHAGETVVPADTGKVIVDTVLDPRFGGSRDTGGPAYIPEGPFGVSTGRGRPGVGVLDTALPIPRKPKPPEPKPFTTYAETEAHRQRAAWEMQRENWFYQMSEPVRRRMTGGWEGQLKRGVAAGMSASDLPEDLQVFSKEEMDAAWKSAQADMAKREKEAERRRLIDTGEWVDLLRQGGGGGGNSINIFIQSTMSPENAAQITRQLIIPAIADALENNTGDSARLRSSTTGRPGGLYS